MTEIAQKQAAHRFPPPAHEPLHAGMFGAAGTALVVIVFAAFSSVNVDSHPTSAGVTIAIGFLAPYPYYKIQERRHEDEIARIYSELLDEQNAKRPKGTEAPF